MKPIAQKEVVEKAETPAPVKPESKGEKWFDWITYGAINGLGTFIITIPIAYSLKFGKGANYYKKAADWLTKKGMKAENAEEVLMTNILMQGGNVMLLPVKALEDNKPEIVSRLNHVFHEPDASEDVKSEADQTWGSLIKSRLVAWGMVFASLKGAGSLLGKERFASFEDGFAKHFVCKPLKLPTHINGQETKAFRYGKLGALDIFATAAATSLLYIASRFFAEPDQDFPCDPKDGHGNSIHMHKEPVLAAPEMTEPIATPTEKKISPLKCAPCSVLSRVEKQHKNSFAEAARASQIQSSMALAE